MNKVDYFGSLATIVVGATFMIFEYYPGAYMFGLLGVLAALNGMVRALKK